MEKEDSGTYERARSAVLLVHDSDEDAVARVLPEERSRR